MPGDVPAPVPAPAPVPIRPSLTLTIRDYIALAAIVFGGIYFWHYLQDDQGGSQPAIDVAFVKIGNAYPKRLAKAYGDAWSDGANALEGGKSVKDSLQVVAASWEANRNKTYDAVLTPEFAKIVPENQVDLSPSDRVAMVRAWRGLVKGLGK